ncbi:MAG: helix-turn-helix domain-containing protein [Dokdonella sp.]|uniref:helix-turn-helix domain-containing protein n=1 Tax=Dokdonella sp. TaxID=2291710 RepID=UPI0025C63371|nr:helix-turn-helix domain-containing protein [Dokdonella sp.]MBZ0223635.1 helix-turn-helix domain-containing protein [Dokdonella sp.]MCC7256502.1 helix-turn-helix domain-containing protein [Dokdonella sp.]
MGHTVHGRLLPLNPIADDGDDYNFCSTCAFGSVCLGSGVEKFALRDLHCLVEHVGNYRSGQAIFRTGERFSALYAVRSGMVKTRVVDIEGRELVLGFYLPGELVGLNAIHPETYPCDAVALDTVEVCRFSFPALATLATRMPGIQQELFRRLSKDIGNAALLAGDYSADERLAAFLIDLARRYAERGFPPDALHLAMSRGDIANYLRLAAETVSRVLRRFQDRGLIAVEGRNVTIAKPDELFALARPILQR